jgi:hypothetical protein
MVKVKMMIKGADIYGKSPETPPLFCKKLIDNGIEQEFKK